MGERFLAIKLADIGDALTITPALRALRRTFPTAQIDTLVTPAGAAVLAGLDSVDRRITFDKARFDRPTLAVRPIREAIALGLRLRRAHYDRVFLFHHLFTGFGRLKYAALLAAAGAPWRAGLAEERPSFLTEITPDLGYGVVHEADYWLRVAKLSGADHPCPRLEISIDGAARQRAQEILGGEGLHGRVAGRYRIALYPGSGRYSVARRWPAGKYAEVGRRLIAALGEGNVEFIVVGAADERDLGESIDAVLGPTVRNLIGATDLKELAAVLEGCDLLVGNDGGVMHLAVAAGTPVVAVFGLSNHISWGPYAGGAESDAGPANRPRSRIIRRDLRCSPCLYRGFLPGTPRGCASRECLALIQPAEVVTAALELLHATV